MKAVVMREVEVDIATLKLDASVRFEDEEMPYDFPHREGDMWSIEIDIDTGKIRDWPNGVTYDLCMKVNDRGSYTLLDRDGNKVATIECDYVPDGCNIGGGDYIEMDILEDGSIAYWNLPLDLSVFFRGDD